MISAANDLVATNLHQCNSLGISWLESDRCSCRNIETVAISFEAIKFELWIRFDEVVMRANLDGQQSRVGSLYLLELVYHLCSLP